MEYDNQRDVYEAEVAFDGVGGVLAVWCQVDGVAASIYVNRYDATAGWLGVEEIDETSSLSAMPAVACDHDGNALVVWSRYDEGRSGYDLVARYYDHERGWDSVEMVSTEPVGHHGDAEVAAGPEGNMVVTWVHNDWAWLNVSARALEPGVGWSSVVALDTVEGGNADHPQVDIDGSGVATVVWMQGIGSTTSVWSAQHTMESGWSASVEIGTNVLYGRPLLDVAADGNATCAWTHFNMVTTKYELYAVNYIDGLGWGSKTALYASSTYSAASSSVGVDRHGNALVLSELWDSTGSYRILQTVYEVGSGWSPSMYPIAPPSDCETIGPKVSVNGDGDALVVFGLTRPSAAAEVWGVTFGFESGWGTPEQVSQDLLRSPSMWDVVIDDDGSGMAIMLQSSGVVVDGLVNDLWASAFTVADTTPPIVSISAPVDEATVAQATVSVSGTTEPGATLVVNGMAVAVDEDGGFSVEVSLVEGENEIVATATDAAGNSASDSITVTFDSPVEDLEQDLQDALADLDELSSELNQTKDSLADSEDGLEDANSRIDSLADRVSLLMGLVGVLAALVILIAGMYVWSKRRSGGPSGGDATETAPPPPE